MNQSIPQLEKAIEKLEKANSKWFDTERLAKINQLKKELKNRKN